MVGRSPRDRRNVWRSAGAGRPPYRVSQLPPVYLQYGRAAHEDMRPPWENPSLPTVLDVKDYRERDGVAYLPIYAAPAMLEVI